MVQPQISIVVWDSVRLIKVMFMEKDIDFSKMTNAEINLKIMGYNNEYDTTKEKIVKLVGRLQELDKLYIKANEELKKRGVLNDE